MEKVGVTLNQLGAVFLKRMKRKSHAEKERFTKLYECDNTTPPLGSGAQGVVSLYTVKTTGEAVVCKVVKANTRGLLHDARREAAIHRKCSSHPLVATLHDTMEFHGGVYMVMEYCAGGTLADLIDYHRRRPQLQGVSRSMPPKLAAHVMTQLAQVLSHIHSKGIVHRDIKADNIMVMSDTRSIRLVDFGLAVPVHTDPGQDDEDASFRRCCAGTSGFIAPEALRFEPAGTAVDVWSAGALLFFMLTGEMPFRHLKARTLTRRDCLTALDFSNTNLSKKATHLIRRMLDFNPETRISAQEILEHPWIIKSQVAAVMRVCKKQLQMDSLSHSQHLTTSWMAVGSLEAHEQQNFATAA